MAGPAAVAPARRAGRRRHLRGRGLLLPRRTGGRRDRWGARRRPVAPGAGGVAVAGGARRGRRRAVVHTAFHPPRPAAHAGPPGGRAVRQLRHPPAGAAAELANGRVRRHRPRPGVAARAVAAAARADRRPGPHRAGRRGVRGPARRPGRRRAPRAAVAVRSHPPGRPGARGPCGVGRAPGGPPLAPASLARALGQGAALRGAAARRRSERAHRGPPAAVLPRARCA